MTQRYQNSYFSVLYAKFKHMGMSFKSHFKHIASVLRECGQIILCVYWNWIVCFLLNAKYLTSLSYIDLVPYVHFITKQVYTRRET